MTDGHNVDIKFQDQHFKGTPGDMLVATAVERIVEDMSELTEGVSATQREITEVNLCVKSIDEQLKRNGNGSAKNNLKRDVAVTGGLAGLVAAIVYAKDLIEAIKALFGG